MFKHFITITIFWFACMGSLLAQDYNKPNRTEKIQALKIAFITQKLNLNPDEAQRFWPVYNNYETDIKQLMFENKKSGDVLENEEKILNIKKRYKPEFFKVIGQPKTNALFNAEKEFRGVLMRQLKNKQNQQNRQLPYK